MTMKDLLKLAANKAATAGAALVGAGLVLRYIDTDIPNCLVAATLSAGAVL